MREVEPAGESLGADEDVDVAGFDGIVEGGEIVGLGIVAVETGDFGVGEEFGELGLEELGAEAFMNDIDVLAAGAGRGDFLSVAADVTVQGIGVGVEGHGQVAIWAEGLPAAFLAEGERGRTAAIVEDEGLVLVLEVTFDVGEEGGGEIVILGELVALFQVDDGDLSGGRGRFGFLAELGEGMLRLGEVIIDDIRGSGTEKARNLELGGHEASQTQSGVTGRILLIISAFVGFVDNDETEIMDR